MHFNVVGQGENAVALVSGEGVLVTSEQDMLDIIATAGYRYGCRRIVLHKGNVDESFFDLKSGLAGGALQKVINYGAALAIVGDFGAYTSNALQDFIRESNRGNRIFFVANQAAALEALQDAGNV